MGDSSPDQVPFISFTAGDNLSPGGSRAAQAPYLTSFSPVNSEGPTPRSIISHRGNGSAASNVGYFVPGNPSDYPNRSGVSPLHQGNTGAFASGSNFIPRPTLPSSPSGLSPAQLVDCFRHSPYVAEHYLEPTDYRRRSIFLELLRETPDSPHHFACIVPRSDGTPCGKTFNRADRGLTHIRTHLDHRPFYCRGRCNNKNW
jgi:hypothetical protein